MFPGIVMGAAALVLWVIVVVLANKARVKNGVRVQGEVSGFENYISKGQTMYVPIYRHVRADGTAVQATGGLAKSWKSPAEGTKVDLLYDAGSADRPLVKLGIGRFVPAMMVAGPALLLSGISLAFLLASPTEKPPREPKPTKVHKDIKTKRLERDRAKAGNADEASDTEPSP